MKTAKKKHKEYLEQINRIASLQGLGNRYYDQESILSLRYIKQSMLKLKSGQQ